MQVYRNSEIRILVVDDARKNIQVIGHLLRGKGFKVSVAQNGEQALEIAKMSKPDLVLLDIIMPEIDGIETCRRMKANPEMKDIPIIFLSALSESADKVKGLKAGAVDYVTKPIDSEELLARVRLHLTMKILQHDLESQVKARTQELSLANAALRKREEDYRSVMTAVPDPIIVYDLKRSPLYINPAFTRVFGWTWKDLEGFALDFIIESEYERNMAAFFTTIKEGYLGGFHTQRYTKTGEILDVSITAAAFKNSSGKVAGAVINLRDITEWKQTQEVMIQNEKMMSLGGLAAGMAHEIKNPLGAVIQSAQVIQNRLFKSLPANLSAARDCGLDIDALHAYLIQRKIDTLLDQFYGAGIRVNTIIDNMLSFSRKSGSRQLPCDLCQLMDKALDLASQDYDLKKNYDFRRIIVQRKYDAELPMVCCEASKIEQVLFNILKNGSEAMHEAETEAPTFVLAIYPGKDTVCIEIRDNGPGMDREVRKKIFDPFFTTKGSGTGLGLSVAYFIIRQGHGGTLEVESRPGSGTRFTICLPLVRD